MTPGNRRKADQLGMAISTASHRLKKVVLFGLAGRLGRDRCYHCGGQIEDADQFSIEHKAPWLYRDTAQGRAAWHATRDGDGVASRGDRA